MKQFKRAKVIMLPTNEKANPTLFYSPHIKVCRKECMINSISQHLYITSDDETKEGDWGYDQVHQYIVRISKELLGNYLYKKIIATTDSSLKIKCDECKAWKNRNDVSYTCTCKSLPQPSQSFIEKYVEEYNKGNIITDIMVEYESHYVKGNYSNKCSVCKEVFYNTDKLGFICPKHDYIKVNPKDNTITIKKVKDSWNREEVIELCERYGEYYKEHDLCDNSKWFKKNL